MMRIAIVSESSRMASSRRFHSLVASDEWAPDDRDDPAIRDSAASVVAALDPSLVPGRVSAHRSSADPSTRRSRLRKEDSDRCDGRGHSTTAESRVEHRHSCWDRRRRRPSCRVGRADWAAAREAALLPRAGHGRRSRRRRPSSRGRAPTAVEGWAAAERSPTTTRQQRLEIGPPTARPCVFDQQRTREACRSNSRPVQARPGPPRP